MMWKTWPLNGPPGCRGDGLTTWSERPVEEHMADLGAGEKNAHYVGKNMIEIGKLQNKEPFDAAVDILIDENGAAMSLYFGVSGDLDGEED